MTERLKSILSLVDEREEVYFLALLAIATWALVDEAASFTEWGSVVAAFYGLLIGGGVGKLFAQKRD